MTTVLMEKEGQADILVDSTAVAHHVTLGWKKKEIEISADGQTLNIPNGAAVSFVAGATRVTGMQILNYTCAPLTNSATGVHANITLPDEDTTVVTTEITNPDVPRVLTIKGNAAGIAGNVVITGKNVNGISISETIALDEASEVEGLKAFAEVTSITVPAKTNASGDAVSVGYAKKFGLPQILANDEYLLVQLFDGADDAGTLALNADIALNLYDLAGTPDGSKILNLIYLA